MSIYGSAPVQRNAGDYINVTRWNAGVYTKLNEIDALFHNATGHDHSGADKGKPIIAAGLASNAVETAKIKDLNVTNAKIALDSISTAQIRDANVTTAKIKDANVTNAKIALDSISTVQIKDLNVTNAKIALDSISTAQIRDDVVTNAKLARQIFVQAGAPIAGATGDIWIDT